MVGRGVGGGGQKLFGVSTYQGSYLQHSGVWRVVCDVGAGGGQTETVWRQHQSGQLPSCMVWYRVCVGGGVGGQADRGTDAGAAEVETAQHKPMGGVIVGQEATGNTCGGSTAWCPHKSKRQP